MNEANVAEYAALLEVDGFVVGRAGLDVAKLTQICTALTKAKSS